MKTKRKTICIIIAVVFAFAGIGGASGAFVIALIALIIGFVPASNKENVRLMSPEKTVRYSAPERNSSPNVPSVPDVKTTIECASSLPTLDSWSISLSFGKSSSQNYLKAVTLAKSAPQYHEQTDDGKILHQAIYSAAPNEYLAFVMLYELVGSWKSSFVFINGQPVDRKIIGQLNYCYGDRCRSGNPQFCYGASYMTENPFGCHRLQMSAANHPWWTFYRPHGNKYVLDKDAMRQRIDEVAKLYYFCPCFDLGTIMSRLNELPSTVSQRQLNDIRQKGDLSLRITI